MNKMHIGPSLLAVEHARIGREAEHAERSGADRLHLDIMGSEYGAAMKKRCTEQQTSWN